MKKTIICCVILICFCSLKAQECNDIVYPTSSDSIISNCCIIQVKYGNVVYFIKNNINHIVEADKIIKDKLEYNLFPNTNGPQFIENDNVLDQEHEKPAVYRGHDYEYYFNKYKGAKIQMILGIVLTITGASANITSVVYAIDNNNKNDGTGTALNVYGIIAFNSGLPLWISGSIKRGNNKRAMNRTDSGKYSSAYLTLGLINNGIALKLYL